MESDVSRREFVLRRREDMLSLRVYTRNIDVVVKDGRTVLVRAVDTEDAYLVVEFSPQHVMEEAFRAPDLPTAPIQSRLAGASRLAFKVTDRLLCPLTTSALLDWAGWKPLLVEHATSGARAAPRAPKDDETALELPWRMLLSPDEHGRWTHRAEPVTHDGWTELWHTRLYPDSVAAAALVRAIWLDDPRMPGWLGGELLPTDDEAATFDKALSLRDQFDIVRLSSDGRLTGNLPAPVQAQQLMLSSLGAWYDLHGSWDIAPGTNLADWQQRGTMGRDHYVRVVKRGCLFPFGHKAVLIDITERELGPADGLARGFAYLRKRTFVVPIEREKVYEGDPAMPFGQREMPFQRIRVLTDTSPEVIPVALVPAEERNEAVVPQVDGQPFSFRFLGTDWAGADIPFSSPFAFVTLTGAQDPAFRDKVIAAYPGFGEGSLETVEFGGRTVAVAKPGEPGDTTVSVRDMTFGGDKALPTPGLAADPFRVPFYPRMRKCRIHLPEAAALVGRPLENITLQYFAAYLTPRSDLPNRAGVYLQAVADEAMQKLECEVDKAAGLANPQTAINGLAREIGPIAGKLTQEAAEIRQSVEDAALRQFNALRAFGEMQQAKLIGALPLDEILAEKQNLEQAVHLVKMELQGPHRIESTMDWKPVLKNSANNLFEATPPGREPATLELHARSVVRQEDTSVSGQYDIHGELRSFNLNLWGKSATHFITVEFTHLRFKATQNSKADLDCQIGKVTFHGALSFVQELSKYISFGPPERILAPAPRKPLNVDVDATGIRAGLSLSLPPLAFGFFSLDKVAFSAGVTIPFTDDPLRVRFQLSTREKPFQLLIYGFGGGGFVALDISGDGVELLEFSFEFGAGVALNLGVASGAVSLMGGIHFKCGQLPLPQGGQECLLEAYLRLNGALSVLGLITLTVEFYLSLAYQSSNGALVGYASVSVSIRIVFFSKSVKLEVRRELAGSGGHALAAAQQSLTFDKVYERKDWERYQAAFAPLGG